MKGVTLFRRKLWPRGICLSPARTYDRILVQPVHRITARVAGQGDRCTWGRDAAGSSRDTVLAHRRAHRLVVVTPGTLLELVFRRENAASPCNCDLATSAVAKKPMLQNQNSDPGGRHCKSTRIAVCNSGCRTCFLRSINHEQSFLFVRWLNDLLDWPQRASNGQRLGLWRSAWSRALIGGANQLLVVGPRRAAHIKGRRGAEGSRWQSSANPIPSPTSSLITDR
jgi:hypothetical protein